jgi:EAL domain-containing protein (putative c-di-GMP-specific phosphodiesterase class I)
LQLALDDFGCGYSSLSYLRRYPVQVLKLDTSYTQRLGDDAETRVITEAIATMASRLGVTVVAEGVETLEQLAIVRELGIDMAQGFLLGAPKPALELRPQPAVR